MNRNEIQLNINNNLGRAEIREKLILEFLKELPGTGKGENASRYLYYVEKLKDGRRIFITRPAGRNNGMDFVINVENAKFISKSGKRRLKSPAHHNIISDLEAKKQESKEKYKVLYSLILKINACESIENKLMPDFRCGYSSELILKVLKWLFIEQDVTYWNNSGRKMLMSGIPNP